MAHRVERKAVLPLADVADARAGADEAPRLGRRLEHDLRPAAAMGTKDQIGVTAASTVRCAISQSLMISWLVSVALEDDVRAVHAGEAAAAARPVVVGRDDELHGVGHRLPLEAQVDDAPRLRVGEAPLRRVARRLGHVDPIGHAVDDVVVEGREGRR